MKQDWVKYNTMTHTYDTPDGTSVAAELVDNVRSLVDVLYIATIREKQRAADAMKLMRGEM